MRKNILLEKGKLLDENGNLFQAGYAFTLVRQYHRNDIKACKLKIKEWDYYYFGDEKYGIALTIDDNSYMGLVSATILNFKEKKRNETTKMFWFPLGKTKMPETSIDGSVEVNKKGYSFKFLNEKGKRHLLVEITNFDGNYFMCDVELSLTTPNSMVIATPFKRKKHFYYNQKINLLKVNGCFSYGNLKHNFKNAYGVLDWGRGVWEYSNTWFWASLNGEENNHLIGFNLGYGFGDTKNASENMLFYDKEVFKLNDVIFDIPIKENSKRKLDFLKPWKIYDNDGMIDLTFYPILDRHAKINALILGQNSHQVFGYFKGQFNVGGKTIEITNILGFAEKVKNRW